MSTQDKLAGLRSFLAGWRLSDACKRNEMEPTVSMWIEGIEEACADSQRQQAEAVDPGNDEWVFDASNAAEAAAYLSSKLRYYGEITESCPNTPTKRYMRGAAKLLEAYPAILAPVAAPTPVEQAEPAGWRELAQRCLASMRAAVHYGETRDGRPPQQTCLFDIRDLEAMLAATAQPAAVAPPLRPDANALQALRQRHAALPMSAQPAAGGVPEGYALVPVEPTNAMLDAARKACDGGIYAQDFVHGPRAMNADRWAAMLAAAPQAGGEKS